MTKNQVHEWHERREDGRKRYIRAYWNSRTWEFRKSEPEDEDWMPVDNPPPELWLALRDLLWRKYQRKKLPFKYIEKLDAFLKEMGVKVEETPEEG